MINLSDQSTSSHDKIPSIFNEDKIYKMYYQKVDKFISDNEEIYTLLIIKHLVFLTWLRILLKDASELADPADS